MRIANKVFLIALICIGASAFAADVVSDTIKLAGSGISDDVILAWAEQQHAPITAEGILALKDHKVSDRVILALVKGSENTPLNVAQLPPRTVEDRGWLRRADGATAPAPRYVADNNAQAAPPANIAPSQTYVEAPTTYVAQPTVTYVDYGYPYYSSYCGYPYYGYGYGYYPGYLSLGFSFGGRGGFHGGGFHGGGFGGGFHGGGFGGGSHGGGGFGGGGTGFVSGSGGSGFNSGGGFHGGGGSRGGGRR